MNTETVFDGAAMTPELQAGWDWAYAHATMLRCRTLADAADALAAAWPGPGAAQALARLRRNGLDQRTRNQRDPHAMTTETAPADRLAHPGHGPAQAVPPSMLGRVYGRITTRRYHLAPSSGLNSADLSQGGSRAA